MRLIAGEAQALSLGQHARFVGGADQRLAFQYEDVFDAVMGFGMERRVALRQRRLENLPDGVALAAGQKAHHDVGPVQVARRERLIVTAAACGKKVAGREVEHPSQRHQRHDRRVALSAFQRRQGTLGDTRPARQFGEGISRTL